MVKHHFDYVITLYRLRYEDPAVEPGDVCAYFFTTQSAMTEEETVTFTCVSGQEGVTAVPNIVVR